MAAEGDGIRIIPQTRGLYCTHSTLTGMHILIYVDYQIQ